MQSEALLPLNQNAKPISRVSQLKLIDRRWSDLSPRLTKPPTREGNMTLQEKSLEGESVLKGAGGRERSDVRMMLLKSLRPLPLMHNWTFWYDRYVFRQLIQGNE